MRWTINVCDAAIHRMYEVTAEPGRTELEIWAELHHENIRNGGEWIETRLLSSGPRTNPWYQEASHRVTEAGDILAFDTDMIGPYGYCADLSCSWTIAHTQPTPAQYPSLHTHPSFDGSAHDRDELALEPGMVVCVESVIAEDGRGEAVKLETQMLITGTGAEQLERFPWEAWGSA